MAFIWHGGTAGDALLGMVGDLTMGASMLLTRVGKLSPATFLSLLSFAIDKNVPRVIF